MNSHERRAYAHQQQAEGIDWAYIVVSSAVITTLLLLAVWAHATVSSGM